MQKRESTFVSPGYPDTLPLLQPLARLPDREHQDIDAGRTFGKTPVHTHERRDPVTEAQGFMLKYAGLTVILLVLAVGLTLRLEWNFATGTLAFALLSTGAYWTLSFTESLFTGPGVERHRLTMGSRVLLAQIDADENVRLAQIDLQADQVALQRSYNDFVTRRATARANAEIQTPRTPQDGRNGHEAYQDACDATAPLEPATQPPDSVLESLLSFVVTLYERDDAGAWANMDVNGYVSYELPVCWGRRGGHTQAERRRMIDLIHRARFAGFDAGKRAWRVSVKRYPDAESAILTIGGMAGGI